MEQETFQNLKRAKRPNKLGKKKLPKEVGFEKLNKKAEEKEQILEKRGMISMNQQPAYQLNQGFYVQDQPQTYPQSVGNNDFQQIKAFYSPQMLENPWAAFQK